MSAPAASLQAVVRRSYGRILAFLSARSGDIAAAEDALAEALRIALETWPAAGAPANPEAWLLTTARRRLLDAGKHRRVMGAAQPTLLALTEEAAELASERDGFPDERLKLMFVCAHPAIAPAMHTPLMLQTVLGLDAARIASAFLVAPGTMGQRLSRAKLKIKAARIRFETPAPGELAPRLAAVLSAIYAAYTCGWDETPGPGPGGLGAEAAALARLICELTPDEPEALGLAALVLHCEARRPARLSAGGDLIPLHEQDPARWDRALIDEAEGFLRRAAAHRRMGRYQLEAAIQSAHVERARTGAPDWDALLLLYDGLVAATPSLGAAVGRIAALANARGACAALEALEALPERAIRAYQPYWALAADLNARAGRPAAAAAAYDRAIGLTAGPAVRGFLIRRKSELPNER